MSNLTAVLHQERIPDTQILSSFCGKFIPSIISSSSNEEDSNEESQIDQICVQYSTKIKIYKITCDKKNEKDKHLQEINIYEIFDKIENSEKFNSLLNNRNLNSIILSLSSYKICFIEYIQEFDTFNTLALYSIDQFFLGGKMNIEKSFRIFSSLTYNYIVFLYDENKISLLRKRKEDKKSSMQISSQISTEHSYSDTINGNKFFLPTIYLNDLNIKYNIYKIINIYFPKKNSELFFFNSSLEENKSKIHIYILFVESKSEPNEANNNKTNSDNITNTNDNVTNENNQMKFNSFMREKVSLGILTYNFKTNEYINFELLFRGIDENAFDFTIIEKEKENFALVFSAYNIQIIDLKSKTSMNYIMNSYYSFIFSNLYPDKNKYEINNYFIENNNNLDLRGGGFLVLNNSFIFSDSKGSLTYSVFDESNEVNFINIKIKNENNRLCAPYNKILIPYGSLFFLSSSFSDGVLLYYNQEENICQITDKIINYSPIINFHLVNDENKDIKFAFTSGYGENGSLSFAYDQFLFYISKNYPELYDIDYMKSINYDENESTQYVICKFKNQKLGIFKNKNLDLENISNNIDYNKNLNVLNFGEIKVNNEEEKIIVLIFDSEMKFYDKNLTLLYTFTNLSKIDKVKVGENSILLSNIIEKKYYLLGVYKDRIKANNKNNNDILENKINDNLYIRCKELTNYLKKEEKEVINVNMIARLYLNKYNFLYVYRNNKCLEIYDITKFLEFEDNMIIEDSENNLKLLLNSSYINYCPSFILNDDLNKNLLYISSSNPTIDFSNSLNEIFNINKNLDSLNIKNDLMLRNFQSFSIESPDFLYFECLQNICFLALIFKSGKLVIYTLYISQLENEDKEIKSIGFKKMMVEKLININYREFFLITLDNLFIPFNNISKKSGIIFNLESNRKIIYEANGELCLLTINKNINFSAFCNLSNENMNNGFLTLVEGTIKYCNLYKDFSLSNYSLLIKTDKINRFPVILTYSPEYIMNYLIYNYIMIEKEMISPNRFQYYMTLRREEKKPCSEIKFEINETITECNVIDIPTNVTNINNTSKYVALGINIINNDSSEDSFIYAKIRFYKINIETGQFELYGEKDGFKGIITMIHSIYNSILVAEGSKIIIYQFIPGEKFIMNKYNYIENKNLTICYRITNKLLLTGDIVNSLNYMYLKHSMNQIEIMVESKDINPLKVSTCNLWVIHNRKCCILFDEENNGYIYSLSENPCQRLCDFNINKCINEIRNRARNQNDSYSYFYSSLNGSIGFINHIENNIYEELNYLCEFIYFHFPFNCGVNPKLFYSINFENNISNNFQKSKGRFIDFKILDIFLKLSDNLQDLICKNILKIDKNIIINNIYELIK